MSETTDVGDTKEPDWTVTDFLEKAAPNSLKIIEELAERVFSKRHGDWVRVLRTPELHLHCDEDKCDGLRFFRCVSGEQEILRTEYRLIYVTYRCSNCQKNEKIFSLAAKLNDPNGDAGEIFKFGEVPAFGPPTPSRLLKLIGPDREIFLKGRQCENQGLGIGAFVYYRRVVEAQKNRILQQIIKVSERLKLAPEKIGTLKKAIDETRFSEALKMAKDALPESLLIDGHSPLQLLHSALSEGVHELSDAECLAHAGSIRVVLGELADRMAQAVKDEAELTKALHHLVNFKKGAN